jgi:transcriptional regulator with XRE-family HTH domain
MSVFAKRLRQAREARRMSQVALAKKAGLPPSQIAHYEGGSRKPSYENLRALCLALRVGSDYLLGLSEAADMSLRAIDPLHEVAKKLTAEEHGLALDYVEMLIGRRPK